MKHVLHIFGKDVRGLWWELSVTVAVTLGMAVLQFSPRTSPIPMQVLRESSPVLVVMTWVLLVVQLVQADALVGTEHDWRTRPIRRRDLVAAKVLFVAMFIGVPTVVGDVIVLTGTGFSPQNHLPGMIWKLLWLIMAILLPAAALGAITRTVPQALLAVLGTVILVGMGLSAAFAGMFWGGVNWVRSSWMAVLGSAVAVGVLWLQFGRHRAMEARVLAAGGTALAVLTTCLMPWAVGFAVQRQFSTQAVAGVTVAPRLAATLEPATRYRLPISITDLPNGFQARVLQGRVRLDVAGSQLETNSVSGDDWLAVEPGGYLNSPARIQGRVWLAILAPRARQELTGDGSHALVSGLGDCRMGTGEVPGGRSWGVFYCVYPYRLPAVSSVTLKAGSSAGRMEPMSTSADYSPLPSELTLLPIQKMSSSLRDTGYGISPDRIQVTYETWAPVAYVERSFAVDVNRLGDYVTGDRVR